VWPLPDASVITAAEQERHAGQIAPVAACGKLLGMIAQQLTYTLAIAATQAALLTSKAVRLTGSRRKRAGLRNSDTRISEVSAPTGGGSRPDGSIDDETTPQEPLSRLQGDGGLSAVKGEHTRAQLAELRCPPEPDHPVEGRTTRASLDGFRHRQREARSGPKRSPLSLTSSPLLAKRAPVR